MINDFFLPVRHLTRNKKQKIRASTKISYLPKYSFTPCLLHPATNDLPSNPNSFPLLFLLLDLCLWGIICSSSIRSSLLLWEALISDERWTDDLSRCRPIPRYRLLCIPTYYKSPLLSSQFFSPFIFCSLAGPGVWFR